METDMATRFDLVQTCIFRTAMRQCGYDVDMEEGIETYQFEEYVNSKEDIKNSLYRAEGYLEDKFGTNMGRIYSSLSAMKNSWEEEEKIFKEKWQEKIAKSMWIFVKQELVEYMTDYYEEDESIDFMRIGYKLFET